MNTPKLHNYRRVLERIATFFMVCMLSLWHLSLPAFIQIPSANAANDFSIKTGYYNGSGVNGLAISGLGFTPEVVIIKADTAAGSLVWKTSAMPAAVTAYLGVATADNTESEITLNADGFTLSAALEVNTLNVRYIYIAFAGSDCTSGGAMCVGSYVGTGASNQAITTPGFQPDLVITKRTTALAGTFRTSTMSTNHAGLFSAAVNDTTGIYFQTLNSDGFTVGSTNNTIGGVYYFVAFKNVTNKLFVNQFTGDGLDNRDISGVGFEPDFVFIKQNAAIAPVINTTECWGDFSNFSTAAAGAVNHIQSLDADGFQVGNSTSVNANGIVSNYFAFGGVSDPSSSGSFLMTRGSYTGNGSSQTIETSFSPDLVIIKGNTTEYAVWSTSLDYNYTHYLGPSLASVAGAITVMNGGGFTVGSHTTVNTNGITYEYIAFGNATSPHTGTGASDFFIGAYSGNGISPRSIDHLGIAPSMVVTKRPNTATTSGANWASSAMAANTGEYFSATADVVDGSSFRSMDSNGFSIGTSAPVNAVNAPYIYFAFKEGTYFDVGSYSGTGVAQDIIDPGWSPEFVWVKRNTAVNGAHRSSSATITTTTSQYFANLSNVVNMITGFVTNGFSVGTGTETNASGGAYQYAAWDSTFSAAPPNTPTNTTPSGGASGQDLNVTLTGSAYSDSGPDAQTNAQWQVDDDSDFASPVWSRTAGAAEITTSVTSGNGTFANELSGNTALDHNTVYYWRVRYSDGAYSSWSTGTSFTTNTIATPTNSSPSDQSTVTTLTPTLTASAFSDAQGSHTSSSAQWQISSSSSFTSPLYDSDTVSYGTTHAVPSATLADHTVYYWRVRYLDSTSQWSSYSTPTRFFTAESVVTVKPIFGNTTVDQGDAAKIDAQVKLSDGTVINDATVVVDIYNPSGTKIVDGATMSYLTGSKGTYRYSYTIPSTSGSYLYEVTATSSGKTGYGSGNFEVRTIGADVSSAKSTISTNLDASVSSRATGSSLATVGATLNAAKSTIDTNLDASVSSRASGAALTTSETTLTGEINANETKIDIIDTNLDSVKSTVDTNLNATVSSRASSAALATSDAKIDTLQTSVDTVSDNVDGIQSIVDASLEDIETLTETIDTKVTAIGSDVDSMTITVNAIDDNVTSLLDDISEVKDHLDTIEENILALTDDLFDTKKIINSGFADIDEEFDIINDKLKTLDLLDELTDISSGINKVLFSINAESEDMHDLLAVTTESAEDFQEFRNTLARLEAAAELSKSLVERTTNKVITKSFLGFGSIIQYIVAVNPSDTISQTVQLESHLPSGITQKDIIDDAGMTVYFDPELERYAVLTEVTLAPGEQKQYAIEMNDVWKVPEEKLDSIAAAIDQHVEALRGTSYLADAAKVSEDARDILDAISARQSQPALNAEDHIIQYQKNILALEQSERKVKLLEDVVTSAGTGNRLLGSIAGVQTFGMWGIVLALVAGVGFMSLIVLRTNRRVRATANNENYSALVSQEISKPFSHGEVLDRYAIEPTTTQIPTLSVPNLTNSNPDSTKFTPPLPTLLRDITPPTYDARSFDTKTIRKRKAAPTLTRNSSASKNSVGRKRK